MVEATYVPVFQGDTRVSDNPNEIMTTILGSCIATCIWDPEAGVGGLNHFLLPGSSKNQSNSLRYGVNAMELLINGLLKKGATRSRLRVKLFGGAKMLDNGARIGAQNIRFAEWFIESENLHVVGRCIGGERGRKIRFWPVTGRAQRCFILGAPDAEIQRSTAPSSENNPGSIELF